MATASAPSQQDLVNLNYSIRNAIVRGSIEMRQKIFSQSFVSGIPGTVVNVSPRNVGLIKRFDVEITGTIAPAGGETLTMTPQGLDNILSQIVYNDLSNNTRINSTGWHLGKLATMRPGNNRQIFGAAYTSDTPNGYGNNWPVERGAISVTTAQTFRHFYEVPLAYSDDDLRGSVFAAVLNATQQLQLTFNPNFVAPSTADGTLSVYKSSTAAVGNLSNVTVTVYQVYMDQLPGNGAGGVAFPPLDCSTIYEIKNTALSGLVAGQDFPIQYANQREFLSTFLILDQAGVVNAGSDVNYFALQAANMVNIFNVDPYYAALMTRKLLGDDLPLGMYYFDFRRKPLNTLQTGNMQLVVNPATAVPGASVLVGWEAMAYINTVVSGASLSAS